MASANCGSRQFFSRLLGVDVDLGGEHPHFAGLPAKGFQKLPHLGRLTGNAGEGFDPRCVFRHCHRWPLPKLGADRRAMLVEGTSWLTWLKVFQLFETPGGICLEIAMEARFGHATQPRDVAISNLLTAPIEGFHAHLEARIGMPKPPIPQRGNVRFAKRDLDHGQAPHVSIAIHLTLATLS